MTEYDYELLSKHRAFWTMFKKSQSISGLTPDVIQDLQTAHERLMGQKFNAHCSTCIADAFTHLYTRLESYESRRPQAAASIEMTIGKDKKGPAKMKDWFKK